MEVRGEPCSQAACSSTRLLPKGATPPARAAASSQPFLCSWGGYIPQPFPVEEEKPGPRRCLHNRDAVTGGGHRGAARRSRGAFAAAPRGAGLCPELQGRRPGLSRGPPWRSDPGKQVPAARVQIRVGGSGVAALRPAPVPLTWGPPARCCGASCAPAWRPGPRPLPLGG